jgi:hypothetical protein
MFVKPRPGVKVRREEPPYAHIPEEGAEVPETSFYVRRVMDGDLQLPVLSTAAPGGVPSKTGKEAAR